MSPYAATVLATSLASQSEFTATSTEDKQCHGRDKKSLTGTVSLTCTSKKENIPSQLSFRFTADSPFAKSVIVTKCNQCDRMVLKDE